MMSGSLHPQVRALLDAEADSPAAPWHTLLPAEARAAQRKAAETRCGEIMTDVTITNRFVPGLAGNPDVPIRVYSPSGTGLRPVVVFFHGGGFVLGALDSYDALCSKLAHSAGAVVVSTDYRLAPEHKFPAAPDDCLAVAYWLHENSSEIGGDQDKIAFMGDSAGGNLVAVTCQTLRDEGLFKPCLQVLLYPMIDGLLDTESRRRCSEGYRFNQDMADWFYGHYLHSPDNHNDPRVSPLRVPSCVDLAPALIVTAGFDPLCDEGEIYAERLRADGVPVELVRFDDMIHGFCNMMGVLDRGCEAVSLCSSNLAAAFRTAPD